MALIEGSGFGGDTNQTDAIRHYVAALIQDNQYVPPPVRQQLAQTGATNKTSGVAKFLGTALNLTGAPQLAQGAYWSVTHPRQRLTSGTSMEVPWVAGKPWFHGSSRAFEKFDPTKADRGALYGPGHYITDNPKIASSYADARMDWNRFGNQIVHGTLSDAQALASKYEAEGYVTRIEVKHPPAGSKPGSLSRYTVWFEDALQAPNVTKYAFKPNRIFNVEKSASKQDIKRIMRGVVEAAKRDPNAPGGLKFNAGAKLLAKEWTKDLGPGRATNLDMIWHDLSKQFGREFANAVVRRAGYDAIRYPGGKALGGEAHHAMVVLNPKRLERGGRPTSK